MKRFLLSCIGLLFSASAFASVTIVDKDDWKIDMSGFLEFDTIHDDTQSGFVEVMGNSAVARPPTAMNGGREQFSVRNTRLAFNVQAPTFENWKSRGYVEMDFLGFDPSSTSAPTLNSEAGYFNNPTLRIRHAYMSAENDGWQILAGQTWAMFGWQPYYFMPTIQVSPVAGMLYSRTSQLRGVKNWNLSNDSTLQVAVGMMRPPQRDAELPAAEFGARWALNSYAAAFTGGATGSHKPQPLSVGVSGTVRQFVIPNDPTIINSGNSSKTGSAVAVDALVPIIPSHDGKSSSHNLVLGGEYTIGEGDGDQFTGWTGGQKSPINQGAAGSAPTVNLDGGIGGFLPNNDFGLMKVQTWNVYLQYHLPENWRMWVSAGYGHLNSANVSNFIGTLSNLSALGAYYQDEVYFANVSHDFTDHIRAGLEYANLTTSYVDGTKASDNRVQLSGWFIF